MPDSTTRRSPPAVLVISTILLVAGVATVYTLSFSSRSNACSPSVPAPSARSPIQHVFFLIKENHAFENYFGDRPGVVGYPPNGSLPLAPGSNATVHPFALAGGSTADLPHDHASDVVDRDGGRNDLFVAEASSEGYPNPSDAVGYYTSGQLPDYYAYARNYTLGDMFFTGVLGPTLPNRLFDLGLTNLTWNSDLPPPASDVRGPTLPGQFAAAGLAWDYFHLGGTTGLPTSYATQIAGDPCLSSHVLPISDLKSVLAGPDPPAMAYIDPENDMQYSEHPPANVTVGDEWTVSVVDAIFESPIGNSSAIFFFYDENGGFWDPVPPPSVLPQGDGFRVPLLVLSAWTPPDAVSHQLLDPSNLMRWTESNWGLGPLTPRLANATLPAGLFNFSRPARPPVVLPTPISLPELAEPRPTAHPHSSGLVPNPSVGPPPARTPSKAPLPTSYPASASYRAAAWVGAGARERHRFARGPSQGPRELPGRLFRGTRPTSQRTPAPARFVESRHGTGEKTALLVGRDALPGRHATNRVGRRRVTARSLSPASKRALRSAPNGTGAPPLLRILRGPLGVGKSTVARALARTLGAHVVSIDRLVDPVWDGGSLRLFLKANVAAAATARRSASKRTDVIVDGCFYWKGQRKDLERRSPLPTRTFTLVAPLATCIARDAGRSTSFGPEAAEAVYRKVMRFRWGAEIDARRPVREIVARIRSDCRETRAAFRDAARPGDRRSAGRASGNDRRGPPVLAS